MGFEVAEYLVYLYFILPVVFLLIFGWYGSKALASATCFGSLADGEQVVVQSLSKKYTIEGPRIYFVTPFISKVFRRSAITLSPTSYIHVRSTITGAISLIRGPSMYYLSAYDEIDKGPVEAINLSEREYVHITNRLTGEQKLLRGPTLYFPQVQDKLSNVLTAIALKKHEYLIVLNTLTGALRTVRGETLFFTEPSEQITVSARAGVDVDSTTAALIKDLTTGQLSLITSPQLFVPEAHQTLVEVRKKIRLESYHTAVVKDKDSGAISFQNGPGAFFLQPYQELLKQTWSTGPYKETRDLEITLFDKRPHFMKHEQSCRTKDNVELTLAVTFFWRLKDIQKLTNSTNDPSGDLCAHARAVIIEAVSRFTLEEFLTYFNVIVKYAVLNEDRPREEQDRFFEGLLKGQVDANIVPTNTTNSNNPDDEFSPVFYTDRGLIVKGVEVRGVTCKNQRTQDVLQEIIMERTNRINRLQKQESENEVRMKSVMGEIEFEKQREELLSLQKKRAQLEGESLGDSEASRVRAFFRGLEGIANEAEKLALFNTLRKGELVKDLSGGANVSMFFTPQDVDLRIATNQK